jgi:spore coat protein CotH
VTIIRLTLITAALAAAGAARGEDESDKFFRPEGPIAVFKIDVPKDQLEQLKREPRKYVRCTVNVLGQSLPEVGIHLKGAAGSSRGWDDKPALTLEFDKFRKGQLFRGMDKIHLNNSVQDPRYMTEILCGNLALAAGVPAARGTHALVELNGRKVGLYVVKEGFERSFTKRHFGSAAGNLYDGGFLADVDTDLKRSLGSGDVDDRSDLKALAAAAREKDLAQRFAKVDKLLDVDKFMLMTALEVVTCHWDGYAPHKNNYKLYHDLKTGKFVFMPHGMDQMWGDPNWPVFPGFEGLIARKLMETGEGRDRYRKALQTIMDKHHKVDDLHKEIDRRMAWLKQQLEPVDKNLAKDVENHNNGLKGAIKARDEVVRRELSKK